MNEVTDRVDLQERVRNGWKPDYVFFWGHAGVPGTPLGKECLSQWYPASFTGDGETYLTAEHYMMAGKAYLFGDLDTASRISQTTTPATAKAFGRAVKGFDEKVWQANCSKIVAEGNYLKFGQNPALKEYLLSTGTKVLVEASGRDAIWGIGHFEQDSRAKDPLQWRGLNLLGFALMVARAKLRPT